MCGCQHVLSQGGLDENVPVELSEAFLALISRSVIEHAEKGRVGALTDRYSPSRILTREEGSPAQDLTAASRRRVWQSSGRHASDPRSIRSPGAACGALPAPAHGGEAPHPDKIAATEAGASFEKVPTWPELQNRIESLLVAGEYGLAREHMNEAERDIDRAPQQFRVELFILESPLSLREKNWTALDDAVVPVSARDVDDVDKRRITWTSTGLPLNCYARTAT